MRIHQETGLYFGTAGPEFVRKILKSNTDFQSEYMEIQEELKKRFSDNISRSYHGHCRGDDGGLSSQSVDFWAR